MHYYKVWVADGRYHGDSPLTYSYGEQLNDLSIVAVPLRQKTATGFVVGRLDEPPQFDTKPIKTVMSTVPLPRHCWQLAEWLKDYYSCSFAEALRQFAPSRPVIQRKLSDVVIEQTNLLDEVPALTDEQTKAIRAIKDAPSTTVLLHGDTGTGKTRVYLELAKEALDAGKSVMLLTPEISLTSQLLLTAQKFLKSPIFVLHSQLGDAARKKIWFQILEAEKPVVIVGPRSALFSPVNNLGLIVLDEAHEPAYKQDQSPYYHASRVASQLAQLIGAKVVLGTATPNVADYYLAEKRSAIVRMNKPATGVKRQVSTRLIDLKDRSQFTKSSYLSTQMIDDINTTILAKQQVLLYLNRRGSAREILCKVCGWHFLCPNCDIPLIYHADDHLVRCHICGYKERPPVVCPTCANPDIIYRSIGTKALTDEALRIFPDAKIKRFDSDNLAGEKLHEIYSEILNGKVDILVGTQILAKGLDLPALGMVGIVSAETSLSLPDFTAEERAFQLLYQIAGRVGRGHGRSKITVQSYDPASIILNSALKRDWHSFYKYSLRERQQYRFPPFSYLMQITCKRATASNAEKSSLKLKTELASFGLPVEIIGPTPSFYLRRGNRYYYQLVLKSKERKYLLDLAKRVPADWQLNIDPANLL